jgi:dephospho-CoA kinase
MNLIGVGGLTRSGKDTLAELLMDSGFYGVSLGDMVRKISRERHKDKPDPISVANMTETSNDLRQKHGADFAIKKAVDQFKDANKNNAYRGLVVYSIRAPAEADYILSHGGRLIWLAADDKVRYQRATSSRRQGEADISFEEFERQEKLQAEPQPGIPAESQMNSGYVKSKATIILENNDDDIEKFEQKAKKALGL